MKDVTDSEIKRLREFSDFMSDALEAKLYFAAKSHAVQLTILLEAITERIIVNKNLVGR